MSTTDSKPKAPQLSEAKRALLERRLKGKPLGQTEKADTLPRRPEGSAPVLSHAQERLWLFDQLEPNSTAYNIGETLLLEGPFDPALFEKAFAAVVARHDALRTTFPGQDGLPVATLHERLPSPVPVVDVSALPEPSRTERMRALAAEELERPFDLARGPLVRALAVRTGPETHALVVSMHHIISDGWSIGILVRELVAHYQAFRQGQPAPVAPLPLGFSDFVYWQRQQLEGGLMEKQLSWWRPRLHALGELPQWPAAPLPESVPAHGGARCPVVLSRESVARLKALAQAHEVTPFMALLGLLDVLLARYTGQTDFVVGSPIAGRSRPEVEGLIGYFVNMLPLRVDVSGNPTVKELLGRVREVTLGAYANADLPLSRLVEEKQSELGPGHPLFQVLFALQNFPTEALQVEDLRIRPLPLEAHQAKLDLSLYLYERDGALEGFFEYRTALFAPATVERMARHLVALTEAASAAPSTRLLELPLLSREEQRALTAPRCELRPVPAVPTHALFEAQVERTPEALALVHGQTRLSYRELDARANQLARWLSRHGVGPETRVALFLERSADLVIAMYAVMKAGGAFIPIDVAYPAERVRYMLADSQARLLLTTASVRGSLGEAPGAVVLLDEAWGDISRESAQSPRRPVHPEQLAYIIYTSGSTGQPKGILVPHAGVVNHNLACREVFALTAKDRVLHFSSPSFDATIEELFPALTCGAAVVLRPGNLVDSFELFSQFLREEALTEVGLPTAFWERWVEHLRHTGESLPPTLRMVTLSGQRVTPETVFQWERHPGTEAVELVNTYGPTEATITTSTYGMGGPKPRSRGEGEIPIGTPWANYRLYILDEALRPVPEGVVGELFVGGPGVTRGYLNRPELTATTFIPDPFSSEPGARLYRTGDRVRWLADGNLGFVGRADSQVKIRGNRVEPGEVEGVLAAHPHVREAVVLAWRDNSGENFLAAYVVSRAEVRVEELRAWLAERLPAYMVPAAFSFLESLPLTPNGKYDRRALPKLEPARAAGADAAPPTNELESRLVELWANVLRVERVGIDDDFFELGGNSLKATVLASRVQQALKRNVPLAELFARPTVRTLARWLSQAQASALPEPTPLEPREEYPASGAQKRVYVLQQRAPSSTSYNMPVALRVEGALDRARLEDTLARLVARHEALRTTFVLRDGEVMQRIAPAGRVALGVHDRTAETLEAELERHIRPFDLEAGPLFRVELRSASPVEHVLFLDLHHIIGDGLSLELLVHDFFELYEGQKPAPLRLQYKDCAAWQERLLASDLGRQQEAYWREALASLPPPLDMPLDFPRPERQSFEGRTLHFTLPAATVRGLEALARRRSTTLHTVLLAGYAALVGRYTGQARVVVGALVAGRRHPDVEPVVGMFANFLPLVLPVEPERSFREAVDAARGVTLAAFDHQDLPFERIVEVSRARVDAARNPLFDTMLLFHNEAEAEALRERAGLRFRGLPLRNATAKLDFKLDLFPAEDGGLRGQLEYNTALYRDETMAGFAGHLARLLDAGVASPELGLGKLQVPEAAELEKLAAKRRALPRPVRVAIASTFTAEPIADYVRWWCARFGLTVEPRFAGYDQVFQELLDSKGLLATNEDINLLLLRFEDWIRGDDSPDGVLVEKLRQRSEQLAQAFRSRSGRAPYLVGLLPVDPSTPHGAPVRAALRELEERWRELLSTERDAHLLELSDVPKQYGLQTFHDALKDHAGHIPFTDELLAALGTAVARKLVSWRRQPFKVIAVDCDNTLWAGVCGEDGPLGVRVEEEHQRLQRLLIEKQRQGLLVVLCSKNNEPDVWEVFDKHPRMLLKREHVVSARINWEAKSKNLASLAEELNLGRDSFVFLDDSSAECAEVMTNVPEVLTLQVPEDRSLLPVWLEHLWALDVFRVTEEDARRTSMYRAERERRVIEQESASLGSFLEGLGLRMSLRAPRPEDLDRVAQLTQRTNQFNLSTRRRTREELERLFAEPGVRGQVVEVQDRFGDYGLVGVVITRRAEGVLAFDTFLLSCRVLGRTVENAILTGLAGYAREGGADAFEAEFLPTKKNQPFLQFLEGSGWHKVEEKEGASRWRLPLAAVEARNAAIELVLGEPLPARAEPSLEQELYELDHVGVAVRDVEASVRLYESLGYRRGRGVMDPLQHAHVTLLHRDGYDTVELVAPVDERSPNWNILQRGGERPYHLCFRVSELGRFGALLTEHGIPHEEISRPQPAVLFDGQRVQFLFIAGVGLIELRELGTAALGLPKSRPARRDVLRTVVSDPERAQKLFGLLGYGVTRDVRDAERRVRALALGKPGAGVLELIVPEGPGTGEAKALEEAGPHVYQLCLEEEAPASGTAVEREVFGALAASATCQRMEAAPYLLAYTRGKTASTAPRASWKVHLWNEAALVHRPYWLPLEHPTAESLLRLPVHTGGGARRAEYVAPRTETEREVARVWRELLGVEDVGTRDSFFDLGGHSLKAVSLLARLQRALGLELSLQDVFDAPTLEALAARLDGAGKKHVVALKRTDERPYHPTSAAQRRLFVLQHLEPSSTAYNLSHALRLEGRLEPSRLESAFRELVRRHEVLRTRLEVVDGEVVQRIDAAPAFPFVQAEAREDEVDAKLLGFVRPFDLSKEQPLRVLLLRTAPERHVLLVDVHHAAVDGVSFARLVEEVVALHEGRTPPAVELQYRDYAAWEAEYLASPELARHEAYWLGRMAGELPVLQLATDFPRPAVQDFEGDSVSFTLPAELADGLRRLATESGGTLYMSLLALYGTVLARYTGQDDIIIGTPVANRGHASLERTLGMFVNTLPLRHSPAGRKTFRAFLSEVKAGCLEAFAHQQYPFDLLVERLKLPRDTSRNPLFDTMFTFNNMELGEARAGALTVAPYDLSEQGTLFDLELVAHEDGAQVRCHLKYRTRLFRRDTLQRLAGHIVNAAREVVGHPDIRLAEVELLSAEERHQLLRDFNATHVPLDIERGVRQRFEEVAAREPERLAITLGGEALSYAALNARAERVAELLASHGLPHEAFVGVLLERSPLMAAAILGTWKAGGAYIPLDAEYPAARLLEVLEDSRCGFVLTEARLVPPSLAEQYAGKLLYMEGLDGSGTGARARPAFAPRDLAYAIYTSGSTGRPKGAQVEHLGMLNHADAKVRELDIGPHSVVAQTASHCFDISVWQFFSALMVGGRVAVYPNEVVRDPARLLRQVAEDKVTVLEIVPSLLSAMLDELEARPLPLPALTALLVTGEALPPALVKRWFARYPGIRMVNAYGPTEASDDITHHIMMRAPDTDTVPLGRPIQNLRIYVLNEAMRPCPIGVKGEIYCAGIAVGRGYILDPVRTRAAFGTDPFHEDGDRLYRTGDVGRWLPDGTLEFFGRKDHQIKLRGFRIELGEIESTLAAHPGISAAAVLVRQDREGHPCLVAYVTSPPGAAPTAADLRAWLAQRLPEYSVPAFYVALERLPLTPNGKLDRKALPDFVPDHQPGTRYVPPANTLERVLADLWANVLGLERVGVEDGFFELGGHSLKVVALLARIQQACGVLVPMVEIFRGPTVREVARYIAGVRGQEVRLEGAGPLLLNEERDKKLFCFPPVAGWALVYLPFAEALSTHAVYGFDFLEQEDRITRYADAVEATDPKGPYVLAGYSAGGNVAFEVARELVRRGREVSDVILFDSRRREEPVTESPEAVRARVLREFEEGLARLGEQTREAMRSEQLREVALRKRERYVQYWNALVNAGTVPARLHVLGEEAEPGSPDALAPERWRTATTGPFTVHAGAGRHAEMMEAPFAQRNAERVRRLLSGE